MNHTLALSATAISIVHAISFAALTPPLAYVAFLTAGCGTSIWNHATTSEIAKWADRATMGVGTVLTLLIAPSPFFQALMLLTVIAYGAGKYFESTKLHMLSHALITFINIGIMASI